MNWISVKERLPEGDCGTIIAFDMARHNDPDFPGHAADISNPAYFRAHYVVRGYTHWMPLPEAPK